MCISDLFSAQIDPVLCAWIRKFTSPNELFSALPELYAKLKYTLVEGKIEGGAVIIGPVHIGMGSVVHTNSIIRGPVIIGENTVVSSGVEIQPGCFIGSDCHIGHVCSIMKSLVMDRSHLAPGVIARNSIVGYGCKIGPGSVLGADAIELLSPNSREALDLGAVLGDYSVVGANSVIRSGSLIPTRARILDGFVMTENYVNSGVKNGGQHH